MKQLITFFIFSFICFFSSAQIGLPVRQSLLPKNNLVVNYDFTKSTGFTRGGTAVTNLAGTASGNATLYNAPIFINSLGYVSFNGSNQYLATPNLKTYFKNVNATVQKSFTMSFWFYPTANTGVLVSELDSQIPSSGFHATNIELVNGVINYRVWSSVTPVTSSTLTMNQWYHVAMVYDGATLKGYLNGVLQGTQTYARDIPTVAQNYAIGAGETTSIGTSVYGKFNLAQYKLFNIALTDKDIASEYDARKSEFDYTIHSPLTNTSPTYWTISSAWNYTTGSTGSSDPFGTYHFTPWLNSDLGWAAQTLDANQYITLSYDDPAYIKGIVVQPRAASGGQWITTANILTSLTGTSYTTALTNTNINNSITDDNRIIFSTPIFAKYVKLVPVTWNNHITLRMGLLVKPNLFTTDNLVVHYNPKMTESYAGTGTTLYDLSANGLTGTMSNITYSSPAFTFNGSSSQVSIPDNAALEPGTGSWSIEVWFKNAGSTGTVVGKYGAGGTSNIISYAIRLGGTNLIRCDYSNGTTAQTTDNFTFNNNAWVQMVYVWDKTNNNIYTYANGVLQQTKAVSISGGIYNSTTSLYLGSYNGGEYSQYFNGQMGLVRIYKKALSATEVLKNYDANKVDYGVVQRGLVMNLATAPSTGSTWTDVSGNGNNGTLVNTPAYTSTNGGGITTSGSSYISTGYNLPSTFTVSVAASFNPTTYWATIFGNEIWNSTKGYIAFFSSANGIDIGSSSGQATVPVNDYNTVHIWDFAVNGTSFVLYKDGQVIGTGSFLAPASGVSTNGLYFGARHTNGGTGATDYGPGTYYSMRVYNRTLSDDEVKINFSSLKATYGL
jgi:hypothetical protein